MMAQKRLLQAIEKNRLPISASEVVLNCGRCDSLSNTLIFSEDAIVLPDWQMQLERIGHQP